jgi:hypothetical protein
MGSCFLPVFRCERLQAVLYPDIQPPESKGRTTGVRHDLHCMTEKTFIGSRSIPTSRLWKSAKFKACFTRKINYFTDERLYPDLSRAIRTRWTQCYFSPDCAEIGDAMCSTLDEIQNARLRSSRPLIRTFRHSTRRYVSEYAPTASYAEPKRTIIHQTTCTSISSFSAIEPLPC